MPETVPNLGGPELVDFTEFDSLPLAVPKLNVGGFVEPKPGCFIGLVVEPFAPGEGLGRLVGGLAGSDASFVMLVKS